MKIDEKGLMEVLLRQPQWCIESETDPTPYKFNNVSGVRLRFALIDGEPYVLVSWHGMGLYLPCQLTGEDIASLEADGLLLRHNSAAPVADTEAHTDADKAEDKDEGNDAKPVAVHFRQAVEVTVRAIGSILALPCVDEVRKRDNRRDGVVEYYFLLNPFKMAVEEFQYAHPGDWLCEDERGKWHLLSAEAYRQRQSKEISNQ